MDDHKTDDTELPTSPFVDCVTCGLPAEITDRFTLGGAPGPVEHVKIVCVRKHWYTLPVDMFRVSGCQSTRAPQGSHGNGNPLTSCRRDVWRGGV
jgi:hypothetical protein